MVQPKPGPARHPDLRDLERFMKGEASRAEVRAIVRHLLAGCPECVAVTRLLGLAGLGIEPLPFYKGKGSARPKRMEVIR
jgi:hypothetical protein